MIGIIKNFFTSNETINKDLDNLEEQLKNVHDEFGKKQSKIDPNLNPVHKNLELEEKLQNLYSAHSKFKRDRGICKKSPFYERAKRIKWSVLSMQLGGDIAVDTLLKEESVNFRKFVKQNKVHQILINRGIKFPEVDGRCGTLLEGKKVAFDALNTVANQVVVNEKNQLWGSSITSEGIIKHWPYRPKEFKPITPCKSPEDFKGYEISVVTAMVKKGGSASKTGHCFLRMKTPEGTYSIGMNGDLNYRKLFSFFSLKNVGCLDNSDRFEDVSHLKFDIKETKLPCTKEQVEKAFEILRAVSTDEIMPFDLIHNNCAALVGRILSEVLDIHVDLDLDVRNFLANLLFSEKTIQMYKEKTPEWIKGFIRVVLNLCINLIVIMLGINRTDEACKGLLPNKRARFNTQDLLVKNPYNLRKWQIEVENKTNYLEGVIKIPPQA